MLSHNLPPIKLIVLLGFMMVFLAGCGFQPIYGDHGKVGVSDRLQLIAIGNIPNREGQFLRNKLIDVFYRNGRPEKPLYKLDISIGRNEEDLGIRSDATSTRSRLTMTANYTLTDKAGEKLFASSAQSVAGYNKLTQQYSIETARENATDRTLTEISNQITNSVSLYLAERQ